MERRQRIGDDTPRLGDVQPVRGLGEAVFVLAAFAETLDGVTVDKMIADDDDVLTWFYLRPRDGEPVPVVNWCHVENGRVQRVRVTFDPRPLL